MERARGAILSIQSQVAYGHVGNSAAVLPLDGGLAARRL